MDQNRKDYDDRPVLPPPEPRPERMPAMAWAVCLLGGGLGWFATLALTDDLPWPWQQIFRGAGLVAWVWLGITLARMFRRGSTLFRHYSTTDGKGTKVMNETDDRRPTDKRKPIREADDGRTVGHLDDRGEPPESVQGAMRENSAELDRLFPPTSTAGG